MKARMRRTSASIDVTYSEQSSSDETLHCNNSKSLDISVSESRIDRMRKLLSSPLLRRKPNCQKSINSMTRSESKVFGVSLEVLSHNNSESHKEPFIPFVVTRLCHFIEDSGGIFQEGLFRISGNAKIIDKLKHSFDSTGDAPLETEGDIASASALLKLFLRELPQPLIPESTQFLDAIKNYSSDEETCVYNLKSLVARLPDENFYTLKYLSSFLNRIALQEENRMTSANLGIVFAPNIFRVCVDNYQGLRDQSLANEVVSLFITNHNEIFSVETFSDSTEGSCNSLCPLTVEIPDIGIEESLAPISATNDLKFGIPALLLHNSGSETHLNRKRKESKTFLTSSPLRSNSEEMLFDLKDKELRRCSSHENILENTFITAVNKFENLNFSNNSSPHPPEAKRRELETNYHEFQQNENLSQNNVGIHDNNKSEETAQKKEIFSVDEYSFSENISTNMKENVDSSKENIDFNSQNSPVFKTCQTTYSFDENLRISRPLLEITPTENNGNSVNSDSGFISSKKNSFDSKTYDLKDKTFPQLDFRTLYQNSDLNEPLLSEHRYSWPQTSHETESNSSQDHSNEMPSNSVSQFLRKAISYEAPLSPSAYRAHLTSRSSHLDHTIPPSPPVEQIQVFSSRRDKSSSETSNVSIKTITKKIQSLKKKIKMFENEFEAEKGFRPSHEQKMSSPTARMYIIEMNKLKKDLKQFKDDYYLENCQISPRDSEHIVCDTNELSYKRSLNDISVMMKEIERTIEEKRILANRPEMLEDMSSEQISEEKLTLQKSLLRFEAIYGRPTSKAERDIVRPVYERYRIVKRLVAKSLPPKIGSKDSIELQPILEHIAMDFTSPSHSKSEQISSSDQQLSDSPVSAIVSYELSGSSTDNNDPKDSVKEWCYQIQCSNLHEMSLSELSRQLRETRQQKKDLRTVLRNFENDFLKLKGRKVEKEDRINMGSVYSSYKNAKGKLRLLEALVSKHESHIFI